MNKIHKKLHLQHHYHTGKLLHHRHTSYRSLAIILGLASVFIAGLNVAARTTADSLYIYARNPAPIPTTPATIDTPKHNVTIPSAGTTITGSCPAIVPRVIMVIFVNDVDIGSSACDANNQFSVPITLAPGQNTIVARSYTITEDPGPDGDPIVINYVPVTSSQTHPTATGQTNGVVAPLAISISQPFIVFGPGKDAFWSANIGDGTAPYSIYVSWGDGKSDNYTSSNTIQNFQHHYKLMAPHDITVIITDSKGATATRHFAAVTPYVAPAVTPILGTAASGPLTGNHLVGIYGAYLLILAAFGFLWFRTHVFAYAKIPARRYATSAKKRSATHKRR